MEEESKPDADDERPPICPACGVTMGIIVGDDGATGYVCLECGFSDETEGSVAGLRRYQPLSDLT